MESFAGRYKRSLMTLLTVPADADPVEVALIRGGSQAATGQKSEAIETLSAKNVAVGQRVARGADDDAGGCAVTDPAAPRQGATASR
jgi:hypothetical protein